MQETHVQSLDWEDPLEEEMATHSSILIWRIPWTQEPGGLQSMGSQTSWTQDLVTKQQGTVQDNCFKLAHQNDYLQRFKLKLDINSS